jgi:hypothetical protein
MLTVTAVADQSRNRLRAVTVGAVPFTGSGCARHIRGMTGQAHLAVRFNLKRLPRGRISMPDFCRMRRTERLVGGQLHGMELPSVETQPVMIDAADGGDLFKPCCVGLSA